MTGCASRPPESSAISAAEISPIVANVAGSAHSWLKTCESPARPSTTGAPTSRLNCGVVHRRVRAERHEEIERRDLAAQHLAEKAEELRHRHRARTVRDDEQHALAGKRKRREPGADDLARFALGKEAVGESGAEHGAYPTARDAGAIRGASRAPCAQHPGKAG